MLEVRLLGTFEIKYKKKSISIPSRPSQTLFAYLILSAGTSYRREKLAGLLWPDSLDETARDNLRHALWRVRKALESASSIRFFHADDLTISFKVSSEYWLDAAELEKVNEDASADDLMVILSAYQGELLPGFYDEWVVLEREHLHSIFEHHLARLMSILQNEKRWLDILDWGERWIKLGQRPEPAYRGLMSAHAAQGDMSKVAATYQRCVRSLKEFGMEPSEQTRALYERLKTGKENFPARSPVVEKVKTRQKTNLPIPITSFIGREKEVEAVVKLVGGNRLATLTGPGGVGKTRLAIQSSNKLVDDFKDGVWWVELAPLSEAALVPQAVAQVFSVRETPGQPLTESVMSYIREKHLLLVLDNCEHLISTCAEYSYDLLTQCANLRILTTSREALDVMGEVEYPVQALSLPALERLTLVDLLLEYEGIRLFVERANAKSGFTLTEQNAPAVLQICQRLDGIPLALELAAARTGLLTVEQIAERLHDRFNLLTQGNRTALPRQQTLRAAIDWSHNLLTEPEQVLFRRLAVFAGGFSLEAAEAVCGQSKLKQRDILNLLGRLLDKSLIIVEMSPMNSKTRYRLLETIRDYAYEKLSHSGELKTICLQHLTFFADLVIEAEHNFKGPDQSIWYSRLDDELDNLRVAATWFEGVEHAEIRLHFAAGLWRYWKNRGQIGEGLGHLRRVLESLPPGPARQTSAYARALTAAGSLAYYVADFHFSAQTRKEALGIFQSLDDKVGVADCLNGLGNAALSQGDYDSARNFYEEGLMIRKELPDKWGVARLLGNLGLLAYFQLDFGKAQSLDLESYGMFKELGDDEGVANVLNNLGDVVRHQNDLSTAHSFYEQSAAISRKLMDQWGLAYALLGIADVAREQGDLSRASSIYRECLTMFQKGTDHVGLPFALESVSALMIAENQLKKSAQIFGVADALRKNTNSPLPLPDLAAYQKNLSILQEKLDRSEFDAAWQEGLTMTVTQAIEFALKET